MARWWVGLPAEGGRQPLAVGPQDGADLVDLEHVRRQAPVGARLAVEKVALVPQAALVLRRRAPVEEGAAQFAIAGVDEAGQEFGASRGQK